MLKQFILVEDFDGDVVVGLRVASELDLGKISLAEGPTELVLTHARPAAAIVVAGARPRRHLRPLTCVYLDFLSVCLSLSLYNLSDQNLFFLQGCQTWDFATLIFLLVWIPNKERKKSKESNSLYKSLPWPIETTEEEEEVQNPRLASCRYGWKENDQLGLLKPVGPAKKKPMNLGAKRSERSQ